MPTDQFSVDGQTVIVTGASQGIGETVAERFAADGGRVVVCSREQDHVDPVAEAIRDEGGEALAVECDVRDRDDVEALVEATVEAFGGVDTLVNNAGANFVAPFEDITPNGWHTIVDSNLTGTYHCSQVAGESMREGDGGAIINVASASAELGSPYMSHYGAAKAAVVNLTTSLAVEWADDGVRVNCIAPGFVATPGVEAQMGLSPEDVDREAVDRRVGTTEEIADLAQFLASPASSYLVGETVTAKGVPPSMETLDVGGGN